jgi:hypothetical protein
MPPLRMPRIIAGDPRDARSFGAAAAPGEWAIAGSFRYAHRDPATLHDRERLAFRCSWLGLESFSAARRVEVATIDESELDRMARRLAAHLIEFAGVGNTAVAVDLAREEIGVAQALADHPPGTLLELIRSHGEQGLIERAVQIAS